MKRILIIATVLLSYSCTAQTQDSLIGHIFTSFNDKFPVYMGEGDSTYAVVDFNTKVYFDVNNLKTFVNRKKKHENNL